MVGAVEWTRRRFLANGLAGWFPLHLALRRTAQDSLPDAGPSGTLWDPGRAGRALEPVTARDTDAAIRAIERQLRCTCGCTLDVYSCRTTDFTCTTSPAMHRRVMALSEAGVSAQGILEAFVREHGVGVLMVPPIRGFNLAGYFVPSVVILGAAVLLVCAMRRWVRVSAAQSVGGPEPPGTAAERERLRRALRRLDV